MAPGSLLIDFSDGLPDECRRLAGQLAGGAIGLVECGYVGGVEALQCGEALIYAGGYGDHIDTVTPQLSALGRVTRIGPQGSGRMYAALSEAVRAAHFAALLEAQAVAHACGFVPDELAVPPLPAAEHARMAGHVTMARRIAQATGTPTPVFDALDEAAQATSIKRT